MLQTLVLPNPSGANPFTFVVPGHQRWKLLAVHATLNRAVGGAPNRSVNLTITDGTFTIATTGVQDLGTEPGVEIVTWTNVTPSAVAVGANAVAVGALPQLTLPSGYTILGTITNSVAGDGWFQPTAWYDFAFTDTS